MAAWATLRDISKQLQDAAKFYDEQQPGTKSDQLGGTSVHIHMDHKHERGRICPCSGFEKFSGKPSFKSCCLRHRAGVFFLTACLRLEEEKTQSDEKS